MAATNQDVINTFLSRQTEFAQGTSFDGEHSMMSREQWNQTAIQAAVQLRALGQQVSLALVRDGTAHTVAQTLDAVGLYTPETVVLANVLRVSAGTPRLLDPTSYHLILAHTQLPGDRVALSELATTLLDHGMDLHSVANAADQTACESLQSAQVMTPYFTAPFARLRNSIRTQALDQLLQEAPVAPVAGPSTPVAGPSTPVAGPSTPVAGPSTPVAVDDNALNRTPPPGARRVRKPPSEPGPHTPDQYIGRAKDATAPLAEGGNPLDWAKTVLETAKTNHRRALERRLPMPPQYRWLLLQNKVLPEERKMRLEDMRAAVGIQPADAQRVEQEAGIYQDGQVSPGTQSAIEYLESRQPQEKTRRDKFLALWNSNRSRNETEAWSIASMTRAANVTLEFATKLERYAALNTKPETPGMQDMRRFLDQHPQYEHAIPRLKYAALCWHAKLKGLNWSAEDAHRVTGWVAPNEQAAIKREVTAFRGTLPSQPALHFHNLAESAPYKLLPGSQFSMDVDGQRASFVVIDNSKEFAQLKSAQYMRIDNGPTSADAPVDQGSGRP